MDTGVLVAIITGVAALIGTIISAIYTQRTQRPSALKNLTETIAKLSAELDTERQRRRALQKQFAETVSRLDNRIFELEEKERATQREIRRYQRKYDKALEIIRVLLEQLKREGLEPDAKPDTGELV